jgi:hypothetical protein
MKPGRTPRRLSILIMLAAAAGLSLSACAPPVPTPTLPVEPLPPLSTAADTPIPTLELPTLAPQEPGRLFWTGDPTYPADSEPGLVWRLTYDIATWALSTDDPNGLPVLAHRALPYCDMVPSQGHGLPPDYHVDNGFRTFGLLFYEVATVFQGDAPLFVTYTGGDQRVLTAFQVNFQQDLQTCLADAETVLATLTSLSATPTPGP